MKQPVVSTNEVRIRRFVVVSARSFDEVVEAFEEQIGMPDLKPLQLEMSAASSFEEMEAVIRGAVGPSDLMVFLKLDMGEFLRKKTKSDQPVSIRYILGNPLIMIQMSEHTPDVCTYAPVTVLIDQRQDGVHLSYDTMSSALAPYENKESLAIAHNLDAKVELLLKFAAGAEA